MSGPKRGTWRIYYDPTPARLADLEEFAARQDVWLERHGSFLQRYLGRQKLAEAIAARDRVRSCIAVGDPDTGFDAYGQAWESFNRLHRQAMEAREQHRAEEEKRLQTELQRREQERARRQEAAAAALNGCKEAWGDSENQLLLRRWGRDSECRRLASALDVAAGSPEQIQTFVCLWRADFDEALRSAGRRAAENAQAVKACVPAFQSAMRALGDLNVAVLPKKDQKAFSDLKNRLTKEVQEALSDEDLPVLRSLIDRLGRLSIEYGPKIRAAQLEKASQVWRDALARCGYSVVARKGPDGAVILQASSFPMKSLNVEVRPDTEEVRLDVNGKHDHTVCVTDVQSLQAELARRGVQLVMTDWGSGKPGSVNQRQTSGISIGGGR